MSISIGNQEVTLSLYQTPDLSEKDAEKVCEMFAEEIAESISESKFVELPPLRFTKETAKASNINMEAIIIDVDRQELEEYESMKKALENVDDLKTECDIDDVVEDDWNEPIKGTEFETFACEEIMELDDDNVPLQKNTSELNADQVEYQQITEPFTNETDTIKRAPKKSKENNKKATNPFESPNPFETTPSGENMEIDGENTEALKVETTHEKVEPEKEKDKTDTV